MNTTRTGAAAVVLLSTTALAMGTSGPATAGPSVHRITMNVVARQLASKQLGIHHEVETDTILRSGQVIGFSANACTFDFTNNTASCAVAVALRGGQLRADVTVDAADGTSKGAVVGGTGAFAGARGTVHGAPGRRKGDTRITVHAIVKS
jgi:hypothetical protein